MKKLMTVHKMVSQVLKDTPETRNSDKLLIVEIYKRYYGIGPHQRWDEVFMRKDLPNWESIGRCRRKIQEEDETMRAVKEVADTRYENQREYIDYALNA